MKAPLIERAALRKGQSCFANSLTTNITEMCEKKNILLIDDDDDELEIFTIALDELNIAYNCSRAKSAEQAVKMLLNAIPDFIFLDVNMPGKNGFQCLEQLRSMETVRIIPVIIYSTHMDEKAGKSFLSMGATACIKKPWKISSLTGTLKVIFEKYQPLSHA